MNEEDLDRNMKKLNQSLLKYFPLLMQVFLDTYGWRNSVLLLGAINGHLVICGIVLRPAKKPYSSLQNTDGDSATDADNATDDVEKGMNKKTNLTKHGSGLLSPFQKIFTDPIYIIHVFIFCCSAFVYSGWFVYLVPHATSKGLDPYQSATVSMITAVASIIGRVMYPPLVEREIVKIRTLMYTCSTISAVALIVDPWMNNFWSITLSASAYFFGRGVFKSLFFVILKGNLGPERFASGFGWCLAIGGIARAVAGAVVGE